MGISRPGGVCAPPPAPTPWHAFILSARRERAGPGTARCPGPATRDPAGFHAGSPRPCPPALPATGPPGRAPDPRGGAEPRSGAPPGCSGDRGGVQGSRGDRGFPSARLRNAGKRRALEWPGPPVSPPVPGVRVQPAPIRLRSPWRSHNRFLLPRRRGALPAPSLRSLFLAPAAPGTSPRPPRTDRRSRGRCAASGERQPRRGQDAVLQTPHA